MRASLQLCGLLLYAICSLVTSQSQERVWHTTTPAPPTSTVHPQELLPDPQGALPDTVTSQSQERVWHTTTPTPPTTLLELLPKLQDALPEAVESAAAVPPVVPEKSVADPESSPKPAEQVDSLAENNDAFAVRDDAQEESSEENQKVQKPRKWMSVPTRKDESSEPINTNGDVGTVQEVPISSKEQQGSNEEVAVPKADSEKSMELSAMELPKNIPEMLVAAEEGIPMIHETIISKKTTVYVTITESLGDIEPLYVNLTGIREFTGQERRVVGGVLDLSDLSLTGEEAKEVISRMAKHKFHKLDLSNNVIAEFPTNTFGPVAFSVKELRLDGNPLLSNSNEEGSMLQRGGLFHLTELKELNLSRCGLKDIDFFTPWNSNQLEVVDLSNNRLFSVPTNLQFFHKMKRLYLDGNPITEVVELPFALLWNLQVLSMSSCLISSISSDPFRNMERLKLLSLEGNNLTHIQDVRLPRSSSAVKMYLSGNPWHCACDMLKFIEHYNYAVRDVEDIRCSSPRWLEGLRAAYLTKEILSLDSIDGNCSPPRHHVEVTPEAHHYPPVRAEKLEVFALVVFALAAVFMLVHILWAKKREKVKTDNDRDDINYIRIDKKPNFK